MYLPSVSGPTSPSRNATAPNARDLNDVEDAAATQIDAAEPDHAPVTAAFAVEPAVLTICTSEPNRTHR
jgi:hypothetical protein